uniref:Serine/threonine-protein kinase STE20-like n=1 Tax=Tursiops truncatus TaxID=9739 RepID=A0A6J3QRK1_TURTR|nr:serine/threonine-protein kinase STE20-like [Tursiops truncatus]
MAPSAPLRPSPTALKPQLVSFKLTAKLARSGGGGGGALGGAHLAASARPRAGSGSVRGLTGSAGPHGICGPPSLSLRPALRQSPATREPHSEPGRCNPGVSRTPRFTHPARDISLRSQPRPLAPALFSPAQKLDPTFPGSRNPSPRGRVTTPRQGSGISQQLQQPTPF